MKYYDSDGNKKDYSFFAKATYHLDTTWDLFADVQYRFVNYKANGKNDKFYELATGGYTNQILNINKSYNFVNPKAGISYHNNGHKAYLSMAYASREPELITYRQRKVPCAKRRTLV